MKLFSFSSINVVRRMLEGACVYLLSSITVNQVYGRSHKFITSRKKVQTIFQESELAIFHSFACRFCKELTKIQKKKKKKDPDGRQKSLHLVSIGRIE